MSRIILAFDQITKNGTDFYIYAELLFVLQVEDIIKVNNNYKILLKLY